MCTRPAGVVKAAGGEALILFPGRGAVKRPKYPRGRSLRLAQTPFRLILTESPHAHTASRSALMIPRRSMISATGFGVPVVAVVDRSRAGGRPGGSR